MAHRRVPDFRPDLELESSLQSRGVDLVAGLDEAGRGAWAGPVVAAAVILPLNLPHLASLLVGVDDSKRMSPRQRTYWDSEIRRWAICVGLGLSAAGEIDEIGLIPSTRQAMLRAIANLDPAPQHLLIDHITLPECALPQDSYPFGDSRSLSIAAASVIAKVYRDSLLISADEQFPGYGLARHKGYGTSEHRASLHLLGPSPIHRRSFRPVASTDPPGR
jgi:ribonuclease HII